MKNVTIALTLMVISCFSHGVVLASPVLWTHDSVNKLGTVDIADGTVNFIGIMDSNEVMNDIAFDRDGGLWGISFNNLYKIDPRTAATTFIGSHGVNSGNALVFSPDGTLYAAGSGTFNLYSLHVSGNDVITRDQGRYPALSAGDLAFYHGNLYVSSTHNDLVLLDPNEMSNSHVVGPFGFFSVFGLATADNDTLYGISFHTVFSVDVASGNGTPVLDFSGGELGFSYGSSFITESRAVPLPPTFWLLGSALSCIIWLRDRKKTHN